MKCKRHPRYQAKRKPRLACEDCWRKWFAAEKTHVNKALDEFFRKRERLELA